MGILLANKQLKTDSLDAYEFIGELALSGELCSVKGVLLIAIATKAAEKKLILPVGNVAEASLINGLDILPVKHFLEVCAHVNGTTIINTFVNLPVPTICNGRALDLRDVYGQAQGRCALEITAAGEHSLLMCGPSGTGKTMLASCLPSILPPMRDEDAL